MKNINEYFQYLYSLERAGMKYDLSNITTLCKALGNPQDKFRSIHIAGTNGKGATASFTASILAEHGLKTGLFTSPHILKFNERIRINGKCISDNYIRKFLDENEKLIRKVKPSFFEVNTALAFRYFADKEVEVAVIEAGLGGRLDSTNILKPDVSIITQVGMDHMQYLGNTVKQIALEKLGIVKSGIPVIVSDNQKPLNNLFRKSIESPELYYLDDLMKVRDLKIINSFLSFELIYKNTSLKLTTPLPGSYQARNAGAAILAAKLFTDKFGLSLSTHLIKRSVMKVKENTGYRGRLELVKTGNVNYILDVSHNPDGIMETTRNLSKQKTDLVIFGIMEDKDYKKAFGIILKSFRNIIITKPAYQRALDPRILMKTVLKYRKKDTQIIMTDNVKEAIELIQNAKRKPKNVLITGSFFLVSDAIKALNVEKRFI